MPQHKNLSFFVYLSKVSLYIILGFIFIIIAFYISKLGYNSMAQTSYMDAYKNAELALSDIGFKTQPVSASSNIIVWCYAILGGLVFFAMMGAIVAPIIHRFFHHFHLKEETE